MSDEINKELNGEGPDTDIEKYKNPTLICEMMPDGNVRVSGPIGNKPICFYILEGAKDAIKVYNPNKVKLPPKHGIRDFIRGGR